MEIPIWIRPLCSINNAHVLSSPRSRQPHEEVPLRKKVVRGVVQSQLRGELRALHRSVSLRVAQAKPRFDLFETQGNPREFLNTHRSLDDFRNGVKAAISNSLSLRGNRPQKLDTSPNQHRLRGIASQDSPPNLQANRTGWGELLVNLPFQLYSLSVAYHQVVPTET